MAHVFILARPPRDCVQSSSWNEQAPAGPPGPVCPRRTCREELLGTPRGATAEPPLLSALFCRCLSEADENRMLGGGGIPQVASVFAGFTCSPQRLCRPPLPPHQLAHGSGLGHTAVLGVSRAEPIPSCPSVHMGPFCSALGP